MRVAWKIIESIASLAFFLGIVALLVYGCSEGCTVPAIAAGRPQ